MTIARYSYDAIDAIVYTIYYLSYVFGVFYPYSIM